MADDVRRLSDELARDPSSMAFLPLGEALRRSGQLDLAAKVAVRGLGRHPHLADAHDLLLNLYSRCLHVLPATLCQPLRRDGKSISKAP